MRGSQMEPSSDWVDRHSPSNRFGLPFDAVCTGGDVLVLPLASRDGTQAARRSDFIRTSIHHEYNSP